MAPATAPAKKKAAGGSGLRKYKTGDVLFNDGDHAESLFIIQKGQLRLYKPKGRGFIEIAVLRAGEVIGEMAYFDDDGSGNKRSCAAAAMLPTEVIEISFKAFAKTMQALNPWFKTIINTLASRLRKANARIRELESNSVSHNYGSGKVGTYEFFKAVDIVKILSVLFLVMKSHGEVSSVGLSCHRKTIDFYAFDVFNVMEVKFDELVAILTDMKLAAVANDKEGNPKVLVITNLEHIRSLLTFLNVQRVSPEDKQLKISPRCEEFLEKIVIQLDAAGAKGNAVAAELTPILDEYASKNINIGLNDLEDARSSGFLGDVVVGDGNRLSCLCQYEKVKGSMLHIRMLNRIQQFNEQREGK